MARVRRIYSCSKFNAWYWQAWMGLYCRYEKAKDGIFPAAETHHLWKSNRASRRPVHALIADVLLELLEYNNDQLLVKALHSRWCIDTHRLWESAFLHSVPKLFWIIIQSPLHLFDSYFLSLLPSFYITAEIWPVESHNIGQVTPLWISTMLMSYPLVSKQEQNVYQCIVFDPRPLYCFLF